MTIKIRGLPASFGISKPIAGRMTTAFVGSEYYSVVQVEMRCGRCQPVRLLGGTDLELCEGEVLLQVERDGEPRGDPQVRRQVIEELL